jgi:hypothetical protein
MAAWTEEKLGRTLVVNLRTALLQKARSARHISSVRLSDILSDYFTMHGIFRKAQHKTIKIVFRPGRLLDVIRKVPSPRIPLRRAFINQAWQPIPEGNLSFALNGRFSGTINDSKFGHGHRVLPSLYPHSSGAAFFGCQLWTLSEVF